MSKNQNVAEGILNFLLTIFSAQDWTIERHLTYSKDGVYGITEPRTRVIHLYPIHPKDTTTPESVLIHEMLHICHIHIAPFNDQQQAEIEEVVNKTEDIIYQSLSKESKGILQKMVEGNHGVIFHMEALRRERAANTSRSGRTKS